MRVKVWGARGSVPTPGPSTNRYGGNTSCLQVTLSDMRLQTLERFWNAAAATSGK